MTGSILKEYRKRERKRGSWGQKMKVCRGEAREEEDLVGFKKGKEWVRL